VGAHEGVADAYAQPVRISTVPASAPFALGGRRVAQLEQVQEREQGREQEQEQEEQEQEQEQEQQQQQPPPPPPPPPPQQQQQSGVTCPFRPRGRA
jgi:hypothetical protein